MTGTRRPKFATKQPDRFAADSGTPESDALARWWTDAVGYQVYLRSFADSDNDGVGDLGGVIAKLDYLARLGVDFVWITPFYPSPGDDWGYDVADYCDIDPLFGDLATLDRLLADAHDRGIRVITDLVPNHTSSAHRWFQAALGHAGPTDRAHYRDYYIWRDPAPGGGPPNNWVGYFGGPAWSLDSESGQYYLHLFLPSQPDLNWRNPAVAAEWDDILRFWLDRGVDGFRVDVAGGLVKDEQLRSNPQLRPVPPRASRWEQWECFEHLHDVFQPESQDVFRRWRTICDSYGAFLHGETYHLEPRGMDALLPADGMHGGYWFAPMHIGWEPAQIRSTLHAPSEHLAARLLWAMSSHDMPRAPTRFGGAAAHSGWGAARTLAFNVLAAFLPGTLVLYQGEELGLTDGEVASEDKLDPVGPADDVAAGRDGCRTPMPWSDGPHNGFSDAAPWLRAAERPNHETAAAQEAASDAAKRSWLGAYRELLEVLHQQRPRLEAAGTDVAWIDSGSGPIVSYRRGSLQVMANVSDSPSTAPVVDGAALLFDSAVAGPHPLAAADAPSDRAATAPSATGTPISDIDTSEVETAAPNGPNGGYTLLPASAAVWQTPERARSLVRTDS
ncbi:alpha-amylase family glycosyl hydrolase [Candidatus Poriferisodalis sp.]|uniref:alpha-amylase family glycosyl hydrolase n=1 Tax=Candidatus Poriferisodalis sp. TaxID=3101277 RepID=UPI003B01440C